MIPIDARTDEQICLLEFDNVETETGASLMISESHISIYDSAGTGIFLNRDDFDDFVRFYIDGIVPPTDSRLKNKRSKSPN